MNFEGIPQERLVRFACDCALVNIELIKPYTDKYDLIVDWLKKGKSVKRNPIREWWKKREVAIQVTSTALEASEIARAAHTLNEHAIFAAAKAAVYVAYSVNAAIGGCPSRAVYWAKIAGNPERIDALYEELTNEL